MMRLNLEQTGCLPSHWSAVGALTVADASTRHPLAVTLTAALTVGAHIPALVALGEDNGVALVLVPPFNLQLCAIRVARWDL